MKDKYSTDYKSNIENIHVLIDDLSRSLLDDLRKSVEIEDPNTLLRGFYQLSQKLYDEKDRYEFLRDLNDILTNLSNLKNALKVYVDVSRLPEEYRKKVFETDPLYKLVYDLFSEKVRPYVHAFRMVSEILKNAQNEDPLLATKKIGLIRTSMIYKPGVVEYLPILFKTLEKVGNKEGIEYVYKSFKNLIEARIPTNLLYPNIKIAYRLAENGSINYLIRFSQLIEKNYLLVGLGALFQYLKDLPQYMQEKLGPLGLGVYKILKSAIDEALYRAEEYVEKKFGIKISLEAFRSGDVEKFVGTLGFWDDLPEKIGREILYIVLLHTRDYIIDYIRKNVQNPLLRTILVGVVRAIFDPLLDWIKPKTQGMESSYIESQEKEVGESKSTYPYIFSFIAGVLTGSLLIFSSSTAFFGMTTSGSLWLTALAALGITSLAAIYFLVFRRKKLPKDKISTSKKVRKVK